MPNLLHGISVVRRIALGLLLVHGGVRAETTILKPLSAWESIDLALRNNPDIAGAVARIAEAEAGLNEVRSAHYPAVTVDTGYFRSNAPAVIFGRTLDQRALDFPNVDFNDPDDVDHFESGATLRYGVFDPGRKGRGVAAGHGLHAARFGRDAVENELIDAVVKAYYTVLEADEGIVTRQASMATIQSELKDTRVRFKGGAALETDVLSLEVRLAAAEELLIRARNARRLALSALANLMGLAPDAPITLSGDEWKPRALPQSYEDGLGEAVRSRPELRGLRERIQAAPSSEASARRERLPRLDLTARGYLAADDMGYEVDRGNWVLGLTLSLDLFDGFRKQSKVDLARARSRQLDAAEERLAQFVQLQVKRAYIKLEESSDRVRVTTAAVALAEKALLLVKKQYEGGAATITRYLEAELDLTNARSRATRAKYDQKKAMAEVGRSIGACVACARELRLGGGDREIEEPGD